MSKQFISCLQVVFFSSSDELSEQEEIQSTVLMYDWLISSRQKLNLLSWQFVMSQFEQILLYKPWSVSESYLHNA